MSDVLIPFDDVATIAGVIASTQRWLELAVIGLNLCPFAKAVYVKRQIRYAVTAATTPGELLAELRHELEVLGRANPEEVDTTLLIHPQVMTDFIDFHFFLREADAVIRNLGHEGSLQIASFHPAYEFAGSAPDDIANCTNRSPHPTLHLFARPASTAPWPRFPMRPPSTSGISRRCAASVTMAGTGCACPTRVGVRAGLTTSRKFGRL